MGHIIPQYEDKFLIEYVEGDRENLLLNKDDSFSKQLKEYQ